MMKTILKLKGESLDLLQKLPENGMDFYIASGYVNESEAKSTIIIRGNGIFIPFEKVDEYYAWQDLTEGAEFCSEDSFFEVIVKRLQAVDFSHNSVSIPAEYVPAKGAHQLLGSIKLSSPTHFVRYTSPSSDPKYTENPNTADTGTLKANTYLTPTNDMQFANTGFGAVGRYAIPLPMPASHLHDYTLPKDTKLMVGTVAPSFGQAGGGVEVKTICDVGVKRENPSSALPDY